MRVKKKLKKGSSWGPKKWQNTLSGGLKIAHLPSALQEGDQILGPERFNVASKAAELDRLIDNLHDNTMFACKKLRSDTNKDCLKIFEKILFIMRWSYPRMSLPQQTYVCDYVKHLLSPTPASFCHERPLCEAMWGPRCLGTASEKVLVSLGRLVLKIKKKTVMAYLQNQKTKSAMVKKRGDLVIKKESTLRWMVETNPGRKDRFWTSWYYAQRGDAAKLEQYLVWAKRRTIAAFEEMYGPMTEANGSLPTDRKAGANLKESERSASTSASAPAPDHDPGQQDWRALLAKHEAWKMAQSNDVNERDPDFGLAPLHYAAKRGDLKVVRVLINHGALVNVRGPDGRTPLHYAAAYSNREVCLELLSYFADANAVDNYGCTPAVLAEQAQNRATFTVITNWNGLLDLDTGGSASAQRIRQAGGAGAKAHAAQAEEDEEDEAELLRSLPLEVAPDASSFIDADVPAEYWRRPVSPLPDATFALMGPDLKIFARRFEHAPGSTSATLAHAFDGADDEEDGPNTQRLKDQRERREEGLRRRAGQGPGISRDANYDVFLDMRVCAKFVRLCEKNDPPLSREAIKGLRRWFLLAKDLALGLDAASSSASASASGAGTGAAFSPTACISVGLQLAEALIADNQEGVALYFIDECLSLPRVLMSSRVALLARKAEILLCLWDVALYARQPTVLAAVPTMHPGELRGSSVSTSASASASSWAAGAGLTGSAASPPSKFVPIIRGFSTSSLPSPGASTFFGGDSSAPASPTQSLGFGFGLAQGSVASLGTFRPPPGGRGEGEGAGAGAAHAMQGSPEQRARAEARSRQKDSRRRLSYPNVYTAESGGMQPLSLLYVAEQARLSLEEAVGLIEADSKEDLLEPVSLCPLLELLADVTEREGDLEGALGLYERAEVVCARALGPAALGTVNITVQVLRLLVSCARGEEGFKRADAKARDLTHRLDQLAAVSPSEAEACSGRVIQLVSLARLLQGGEEKAHVDAATDDAVRASLLAAKRQAVIIKPTKTIQIPSSKPVEIGGVSLNKKKAAQLMRDLSVTKEELLALFKGSCDFGLLPPEQKIAYKETFREYRGYPVGTLHQTANPYGSFAPGWTDGSPVNPHQRPKTPLNNSNNNSHVAPSASASAGAGAGLALGALSDSAALVSQSAARILSRRAASDPSAITAKANEETAALYASSSSSSSPPVSPSPYAAKLRGLMKEQQRAEQEQEARARRPLWQTSAHFLSPPSPGPGPGPGSPSSPLFGQSSPSASLYSASASSSSPLSKTAGSVLNATTGTYVSSSLASTVLLDDEIASARELLGLNASAASEKTGAGPVLGADYLGSKASLTEASKQKSLMKEGSMRFMYTDAARAKQIAAAREKEEERRRRQAEAANAAVDPEAIKAMFRPGML